jgi:tetratricopeptide (TPR) repeat protein
MNLTSGDYTPEVDEFALTKLTPVPSVKVKPPRVAEAPMHMECKVVRILPVGKADLILGEIVQWHVRDDDSRASAVWRPSLVPLVLLFTALGGCTSAAPPELNFRSGDPDSQTCRAGSGAAAISACYRVLDRSDPFSWPGSTGQGLTPVVYESRAHSAWHLARHLSAVGRDSEAFDASKRSIELFERYDRERVKTAEHPAGQTALDKQTENLRANLSRTYYTAGLVLIRLRRWSEATRHLRESVKLDPGQPVAWGGLGVATNQTGEFDESVQAFTKATELSTSYFIDERAIQQRILAASRERKAFPIDQLKIH